MLPPLPRCSGWVCSSLIPPSRVSLPRKGYRVGLHIDLFEACSAFTRVAACTLARSPIRDPLSEGFRHFVSSMPAPVASGWSESPGGACTHWKAPPYHGAPPFQSLIVSKLGRLRWVDNGPTSFGLGSNHPAEPVSLERSSGLTISTPDTGRSSRVTLDPEYKCQSHESAAF